MFFFFKQKTAYEMRISDWSSDVCSSDLTKMCGERIVLSYAKDMVVQIVRPATVCGVSPRMRLDVSVNMLTMQALSRGRITVFGGDQTRPNIHIDDITDLYLFLLEHPQFAGRSEEHPSELQSLMRIS